MQGRVNTPSLFFDLKCVSENNVAPEVSLPFQAVAILLGARGRSLQYRA